ncbi:MAG: serine hydrolase [Ruminococcaceae bacterium]|nr:serine hydrolase [Oscillospiraceae bacterium]
MSRYELPVATPESVGIPSAAIQKFLNRLEEKRLPMHSILMLRHGKLVFETYWKPFDKDRKHRMYSTSKSFVSAAIGILAGEGKISLDDTVASFFPDLAPKNMHPYVACATIRDMLMMATPFLYGHCTYSDQCQDWAKSFFDAEPSHLPGKIFSYDTTATVMLSIIIKRVTGVEFTEYLRDRFFEPAGMNTDIWCVETPCGHEWGGSGVECTPRDLMKFALVFLNGGKLNGKQIVPEDYARAAVSRQIDNSFTAGSAEHTFGYGYQFWRHRYGWSCRGMGSQLAIAFPDQDFICITTGDTQAVPAGCGNIYDALYAEILPCLNENESLPEDPAGHQALLDATADQELLCCVGKHESPLAGIVSGKTYRMDPNGKKPLKWVRFNFEGDEGTMEYENETGVHAIRFGFGHQVKGVFPETHYYGKRIGTPAGRGYECHASAGWVGEQGLLIYIYATDDYLGTIKMNFAFVDDRITLQSFTNAEWFFREYNDIICAGVAE